MTKTGDVFVVIDGVAKKVRIKIKGNVGELFHIGPADPAQADLLLPGSQVISDQIHFLQDGESVRVVKTVGL